MARETYVFRDGACLPKHLAGPLRPRGPASGLARPYVVSDGCEFVSMASGKVMTSKAAYRADLKARGLVEIGTDTSWQRQSSAYEPTGIEQDISRVYDQVMGC